MHKYIIGIDEVGRGPLAGPVGVGVALVPANFDWDKMSGVTDSKKLSEQKREEIFFTAKELKKVGKLNYAVSMVSAKVIDRIGIVPAINLAMARALKIALKSQSTDLLVRDPYSDFVVKLDGGLRAPERFLHQETIIKGDSKEKVIGLASIVAKVTRDRYMVRKSKIKTYAQYDFDQHKGYGTKAHREAIVRYGISDHHRTTFCRNVPSEKI